MPPQPPCKPKTALTSFLRQAPAPPSSELTSDPFVPLPPSSSAPLRGSPAPPPPRVLAVEIPLAVLRPIAFRVFTKKHSLTLKSDALALLCQFVGRKCGADWRDSGAGEKVLDEVARRWKRAEAAGRILVDGGDTLKSVLRGLDVPAAVDRTPGLSRSTSSFVEMGAEIPSSMLMGGGSGAAPDAEMADEERGEIEDSVDPREFFHVVDAFDQPKIVYSAAKKMFERGQKPSLFPPPTAKTTLFRSRYHVLHSRLLRNESFLTPTYSKATASAPTSSYRLTPISALLGRAGKSFLLFGMLGHSPAGTLSLYDPTGDITLDMAVAQPLPDANANWFCPGMFVIVDGVYEEDGRFTVFTVLSPPPERREASAEIYGHVDFLGTGITLDMSSASHGGQQGRTMRQLQAALTHVRWVAAAELTLDTPRTLQALRRLFAHYADDPPMLFVLAGNFSSIAIAPGDTSAIRGYKETFDALAALLADFPDICTRSTLLFVPGDNDPWASHFAGGSTTAFPRRSVPEVLLNRVKRVAKDVRCCSNPCRLGYFASEVVVCRDDVVARLQRSAIRFGKPAAADDMEIEGDGTPAPRPTAAASEDVALARKLVKTLLDQGQLSPFPVAKRPVLWDFAPHTLSLCPLPTAMFLVDAAAQPFTVTYEGCHVMNPGRCVVRHTARWIEYAPARAKGAVVERGF